MYSASNAFHQAVKNGEPQKPLLIFSNRYFTDYDIDVQNGIEFNEYFCTEEDIAIGQTLSNEISFTLFNDDRSLNNFAFGEFQALLGVRTLNQTYGPAPSTVSGYASIGHNYFYRSSEKKMLAFVNGMRETYEFVPLGTFIAKRPDAPDKIMVDITCYDRMQKFEKNLNGLPGPYPISASTMFNYICRVADVTPKSNSFINSDLCIEKETQALKTATLRDVLHWIAEISGSNARFDRDGYLVLDWVKSTSQSFSETDYVTFDPYWYSTQKVDGLNNRTTNNGIDVSIGGSPTYLVQDNPFLEALNDSLRDDKIREKKQEEYEKEARKIPLCILENGLIDYEKLMWMTDDEDGWGDQSQEWNTAHPDRHYKDWDEPSGE